MFVIFCRKFEIDNAASITSIYAIKARELILINLLQRLSDKKVGSSNTKFYILNTVHMI